jgi:hypothetical protein
MLIALPACMQVRLLVVGATNRPQVRLLFERLESGLMTSDDL